MSRPRGDVESARDTPKRDPWYWHRWAIEQAEVKALTATEAHVLLALARWADAKTGKCGVRVERIAAAVRREERRTSETLVALCEKGLIKRRRRGPGKTTETELDPQSSADQDPQPVADQDPQPVADQDQDPQSSADQDPQPVAGKTRSRSQVRPATTRAYNNQENDQRNVCSPNPSRCAGPREGSEAEGSGEDETDLVGEVCSILAGGIEALPLNDHGRPWPSPRRSEIAEALREVELSPDLTRRAAREAREIVLAEDRAPNVTGLFEKKLRQLAGEAEAVRDVIRDSLGVAA